MARTTGCMCRVPITDAAVPTFDTTSELEAWARANSVDLAPDHRGRPSIDLETAYRLHADASAQAAAHAVAEAERVAREKAELAAAQELRQSTYVAAHAKALRSRKGGREASQLAWEAVGEAERNTPDHIRHKLAGVRVPVGG